MRWRLEGEKWHSAPLPKKYKCKYCYDEEGHDQLREVYYMHDDFLSKSTRFKIMMVCSKCTYHLMPIEVSLTAEERSSLADTPLKKHCHGILYFGGAEQPIMSTVPIMPYTFKNGKPQYPNQKILDKDIII